MASSFSSEFVKLKEEPLGIKKIILSRKEIKNAFNAQMILDLKKIFEMLSSEDLADTRLVIICGDGDTFCAGADLSYMKEQSAHGFSQNLADAKILGGMFFALANIPVPVISAVKNAAIGGGFGLCCASDFVLCDDKAKFATSEVRLGLIPGVISPYIVRKIGVSSASELMLSGKRISATEAFNMKLVNQVVAIENFDESLEQIMKDFLMAEPYAARKTKDLIKEIFPLPSDQLFDFTAQQIAKVRAGPGAKKGLEHFFAKTKPDWCP